MLGELSVIVSSAALPGWGWRRAIGFLIGTAVKVALAFLMIGIFLAALFWFSGHGTMPSARELRG